MVFGDELFETCCCIMVICLQCTDVLPCDFRDFLIAEVIEISHIKDYPLLCRKFEQCFLQQAFGVVCAACILALQAGKEKRVHIVDALEEPCLAA